MTVHRFTEFKRALGEAEIDLGSGGDTVRALLLMTDTTADTEEDVNTVSGFTTLDEHDGSGYGRVTISGTLVKSDSQDLVRYGVSSFTFSAISVGTRSCEMLLIIIFNTADSDSPPICGWTNEAGLPADQHGNDMSFNANSLMRIT